MGRAIATRFAEAGADVSICDLVTDTGELETVAREIRELGQRCYAAQCDVRNKTSVDRYFEAVEDNLGEVDILMNCAGVLNICSIADLPEQEWSDVIDTNLKGTLLCCQAAANKMRSRRSGVIINIASIDAYNPIPYQVAYNCSKTGVVMLTNILAFELGKYNVRVNAIAPGFVRTPMVEYLKSDPIALTDVINELAIGRLGEPIEIANVALFLASDLASFVTGATWRVDGGSNAPSLACAPETADL